jgi:hypothetical protein
MAEDEAAGAATTTMEQQEQEQEHEHEQQEQSEPLQEHTEQTATPEPEPEEGGEKKKVKRKPKRRTMDAHFWGMSDAEIASIKASLAADLELEQARAAAQADQEKNGADDATPGAADALVKQEDGGHAQDEATATAEEQQQEQPIPEGQLPPEEIQARRRILHTNWRMAAFSQFTHCFPHLCIKEFSIDKLERDLEGTEPGYYVGEVISRLLYHLTKDSALA